jgi:hypothetical protein
MGPPYDRLNHSSMTSDRYEGSIAALNGPAREKRQQEHGLAPIGEDSMGNIRSTSYKRQENCKAPFTKGLPLNAGPVAAYSCEGRTNNFSFTPRRQSRLGLSSRMAARDPFSLFDVRHACILCPDRRHPHPAGSPRPGISPVGTSPHSAPAAPDPAEEFVLAFTSDFSWPSRRVSAHPLLPRTGLKGI